MTSEEYDTIKVGDVIGHRSRPEVRFTVFSIQRYAAFPGDKTLYGFEARGESPKDYVYSKKSDNDYGQMHFIERA